MSNSSLYMNSRFVAKGLTHWRSAHVHVCMQITGSYVLIREMSSWSRHAVEV